VYWKEDDDGSKPRAQDRLEAASRTVMLDLALLKAEIETGMYKKPIEMMARDIRHEPLPTGIREVVTRVWRGEA
jgi:hypothetical protein